MADMASKRFLQDEEPEINKGLIVLMIVSGVLLFGGIGYYLFFF